jgi:hypothetical protein
MIGHVYHRHNSKPDNRWNEDEIIAPHVHSTHTVQYGAVQYRTEQNRTEQNRTEQNAREIADDSNEIMLTSLELL